MNQHWGRRYLNKLERKESKKIQRAVILRWLKKGWYEVNLELVEQGTSISCVTFWKMVKELMP